MENFIFVFILYLKKYKGVELFSPGGFVPPLSEHTFLSVLAYIFFFSSKSMFKTNWREWHRRADKKGRVAHKVLTMQIFHDFMDQSHTPLHPSPYQHWRQETENYWLKDDSHSSHRAGVIIHFIDLCMSSIHISHPFPHWLTLID